jgi:predicted phage tail component-like protein
MNYLIWRGNDSREIKGLIISELPPISKPQMRVSETVIDGVDGSIIEELGYSSYDKALIIGIKGNADIDEIIAYFTGNGEVVFSNEPYRCYKATIVSQIDFERLVRYRVATVTFRVQPFKYEYEEEKTIVSAENMGEQVLVVNEGNYFSKPVIEIGGSGSVELIVNGNKMFRYTFPDGEYSVIVDSEKQDAYFGSVLKNRNMSGEFPTFDIGINTITWEGNVTSLSISSKSRWL